MRLLNNRWTRAAGMIAQDEELREHARQVFAAVGAALPSLAAIKDRVATVIKEDTAPPPVGEDVLTPSALADSSASLEWRDEPSEIRSVASPQDHHPLTTTS